MFICFVLCQKVYFCLLQFRVQMLVSWTDVVHLEMRNCYNCYLKITDLGTLGGLKFESVEFV